MTTLLVVDGVDGLSARRPSRNPLSGCVEVLQLLCFLAPVLVAK